MSARRILKSCLALSTENKYDLSCLTKYFQSDKSLTPSTTLQFYWLSLSFPCDYDEEMSGQQHDDLVDENRYLDYFAIGKTLDLFICYLSP